MKKIALLLSLVMVLSCLFVMASCGEEETSTPADSAAESAAESKEEPAASSEEAPASEEPSEEPTESSEEGDEPAEYNVGEFQQFWVTHYNDGFVEGSGVIFTEMDTAGGWWLHVAFAPVDVEKGIYEIVAITNGLPDGSATVVEFPEGGFVWGANYGNDYPTINPGDPSAINYTSESCTSFINFATTWAVGDRFAIDGVDFENVPTSTPEIKWYDASYVCTAKIAPVK